LGLVGLSFGLVGFARPGARLALSRLNASTCFAHRSLSRPRAPAPFLGRTRRRHPSKHLEARRVKLLGQAAGAKKKARPLVERSRVQSLCDPLDDRVADRASLVAEHVPTEMG
jgi:hypothetical protein